MTEESFEASQRLKNPKKPKAKKQTQKNKNKKHKAGIHSDHPGWQRPMEKSEASQCPQLRSQAPEESGIEEYTVQRWHFLSATEVHSSFLSLGRCAEKITGILSPVKNYFGRSC